MKRLTNKLFISILTVAFAVIALGTTSFAWFTLGNTATVSSFNATVTAGEGIEMSLDATAFDDPDANWYSTIPTSVINNWLKVGDTGEFRFTHVTTADNETFYTMDDSGALVLASAGDSAVGDREYISFTLSFRSTQTAAPSIYWKDVQLTSNNLPWRCDVPTFMNGEGVATPNSEVSNYSAANAVRIGVVGSLANIVYELADSETDVEYDIIGNSVLGQVSGTSLEGANGSVAYYYAKNDGVYPSGADAVTVPATITDPDLLDVVQAEADPLDLVGKPLVTLTQIADNQWFGTVTVNIWIEGWDPDCFNSILKGVITTSLIFSTEYDYTA
ncbi:MAG TPA: hypothetical protein DD618_03295 [Acholeplasmatales bacterium]|nr:hypothetical protein [Acholeplasmatales bacterium]